MHADTGAFIRLAQHPYKFLLFLFTKLPSAFFAGVRIQNINEQACTVTVPFRWFSQNPFRSTYFACLAMAAELSTGALAMAHTYNSRPSVSLLVTGMDARFLKKATGVTVFTCTDGLKIRDAIAAAVGSAQAGTVTAVSTGCNLQGEVIAEFSIAWSFKARS